MISKPPALLVSWPQRLRADQKVKRACCGITWAILGHARPEYRYGHRPGLPGGQIPFRGVLCCSHGIGHKLNVVYRQLHWLAGTSLR